MNVDFVLKEFKKKKEFLSTLLLEKSKGTPLRERIGIYSFNGIKFKYEFHGLGCTIIFKEQYINFDIRKEGEYDFRIDGFSLYEIKDYLDSSSLSGQWEIVEEYIDLWVKNRKLVKRGDVYYLAEDLDNKIPLQFQFNWDKDWYLKHG